jgi:hypothetical protein
MGHDFHFDLFGEADMQYPVHSRMTVWGGVNGKIKGRKIGQ